MIYRVIVGSVSKEYEGTVEEIAAVIGKEKGNKENVRCGCYQIENCVRAQIREYTIKINEIIAKGEQAMSNRYSVAAVDVWKNGLLEVAKLSKKRQLLEEQWAQNLGKKELSDVEKEELRA
jgi:hypothetical protein